MKIRKKIKILTLLKLIIFGYLIILYYNNHNDRIKEFDFLQYYLNKIKTFKFAIEKKKNFQITIKIDLDYENVNFAVIRRANCPYCGLFSNYILYLWCIRKFLNEGFIPILEFESYKNTINGFTVDPTKGNPWEYFFNQPFGYEYNNVIRKAKNIKYFECKLNKMNPQPSIFLNKAFKNYWHILANKYIPIKNEIIIESNRIMKTIFKGSKNVLGVLLRGTDYVAMKPRGHPIPPKTEDVIKNVKLLDNKNKYNWIFLATEDNNIRDIFIKSIGIKVKCLLSKTKISYNYSTKKLLALNINFKKNLDYNKIYLLNIIILSKCLDFLAANTSGTIGVFILTEGYRYYKVYNLGNYK
jgi:hypothetical protein